MSNETRGYVLPDIVSPGGLKCLRVYIPDDPLYLREFWDAYSYFTQWSAWKRDPLKRGKAAAVAWRSGFDLARSEYLQFGGCIMAITDVRVDPLRPCVIQVQIDGDPAWIDKADMSRCGGGGGGSPVLRFNGTTIQYFDPCTMAWVDSAPPDTLNNVITSPPQYIGIDNGNCLAAANSAAWLDRSINVFLDAMIAEGIFALAAAAAMSYLVAITGLASWMSILLTVAEALQEYASDAWDDIRAVDLLDAYKCLMVYSFADDGSMSEASYQTLVAAVTNKRNSYVSTTPEYAKWDLNLILLRNVGAGGLVKISTYAGITSADCSDCGWRAIFDFTTSRAGFMPENYSGQYWSAYSASEGWRSVPDDDPDPQAAARENSIRILFESTTLTSLRIECDIAITAANVDHTIRVYNDTVDLISEIPIGNGNDQSFTWDGSAVSTGFGMKFDIDGAWPNGDPGGDVLIKRVVLTGTGTNPFA